MRNLVWLQVRTLIWKNWIVLSKHWITTILRCLIIPIGYAFFVGYAQVFFHRLNNYGMGSPTSILPLNGQFNSQGAFLWADETDGTYSPAPTDIIARMTYNFTPQQRKNVHKLESLDAIRSSCPQNLNEISPCFAGIGFTNRLNDANTPATFFTIVNYTIFADSGLSYINPPSHDSDFEKRILPLQWSLDKAIIELRTGLEQQTPLEWAYTNATNHDQKVRIRLSYIRGIREIISLALFLCFVGISYQIPGSTVNERALLITTHMKVMGLLDSARTMSWHIGTCITYLPAWIVVSLAWKYLIFLNTSADIMVVIHVLLGLVLASWSFMTAAPFSSSPQLAAIISTFLAIVCALLGLVINVTKVAPMVVFVLFFPPSFYIYALKSICGYENQQMPVDILKGDPDHGIVLLPLICVTVVNIFLWPFLAVLLERYMHDAQNLIPRRSSAAFKDENFPPRSNTAISIRNLNKVYKSSVPGSRRSVSAVEDLSLDIPMSGIFVLLGSNGAGKSTTLSIIAGLTSMTSGAIFFDGEYDRPRRGVLGIVPQKNVLFPELTCLQTLKVWKSVKWSENSEDDEDLELLLRDCDLGHKIHANAGTLSGGQKRKLQLAIGLLSGSKVVLVDECTSGVDPLSRRALWKTLLQYRKDRTIVFTTHFLDEADLLADEIAILAPPGKVVASGSPVELKRKYGQGCLLQVTFEEKLDLDEVCKGRQRILEKIHNIAPMAHSTSTSSRLECYHLNTKESSIINEALQMVEEEKQLGHIFSYDLLGTTIEDVFLAVVDGPQVPPPEEEMSENSCGKATYHYPRNSDVSPKAVLGLPGGRPVSSFHQARTIFYKRALISKRNWPTPVLALLIAVVGSCAPLLFLHGRHQSCSPQIRDELPPTRIYLPSSPLLITLPAAPEPPKLLYASPPGIISTLGPSTNALNVKNVADNATFVDAFKNNFHDISIGGVSVNLTTGESLVAWEASPPGFRALSTLNMASNILLNRALNSTGNARPLPTLIQAEYVTFKKVTASTLVYLKWTFFFGAIMAIYPAFSALYVVRERCSSVQAMQYSNGLTDPFGLWLGHLMFDTLFSTLLATIIIMVFALVSDEFHGLGIFWLILVLYGVTGHLFAYCLSHLASSALGAFALVASYQISTFMIYITAYMAIFTFGPIASSSRLMTIVHFSTSFISPVTSVTRAALVSVNLFSLGCDGTNYASGVSLVSLTKLGGPLFYLVIYILVLSAILFRVGFGSISNLFRAIQRKRQFNDFPFNTSATTPDCGQSSSTTTLLQVAGLSKVFNGKKVVDNVDINVEKNATFALLGPNGAGKTTTFNIIRGDIKADAGDVLINGHSIVRHPVSARSSLGVCPQFTAIDPQLTVREHLIIYGRLKGLNWGEELNTSVEAVLQGTSLSEYAGRMANRLSGGNQRKLSLAIALLGNPSVLLIDEFSSGVDPKMKREMWGTLRNVSKDKAIIITTHSMEEASALATCVGILAKRMLTLGTPESLTKCHGMYEIHFCCPTPEDVVKARSLMSHVPGASMINDVTTRFEVPVLYGSSISPEEGVEQRGVVSLANLYNTLSSNDNGSMEYTVEKASLESVFLKVIREHNIKEQEALARDTTSTRWWKRSC